MPHDRVYFTKDGKISLTMVEEDSNGKYKEVKVPNPDKEIEELFGIW